MGSRVHYGATNRSSGFLRIKGPTMVEWVLDFAPDGTVGRREEEGKEKGEEILKGKTFSLMASWTRRVSVETLKTISPVLASVSKNPTSCLSTASKYFFLRVLTCLSPLYIQHPISVSQKHIKKYPSFLRGLCTFSQTLQMIKLFESGKTKEGTPRKII